MNYDLENPRRTTLKLILNSKIDVKFKNVLKLSKIFF